MTKPTPPNTSEIIAANLMALHARLEAAEETAGGAIIALAARNQNLAIGHLLDLDRILPECDALYRTIILMHRSGDNDLTQGGAA
jgi:hypothetical protein